MFEFFERNVIYLITFLINIQNPKITCMYLIELEEKQYGAILQIFQLVG